LANQLRTVQLREELCVRAETWLKGRFDSLEGLLSFLLEEIIKEEGAKLDQREEEIVQQRLRDLGYI
jgi:hypothetical protein